MKWQRFFAVFHARNKEFIRDRASLAWNLVFPLLIMIAVAVMVSDEQALFKVGVIAQQDRYIPPPPLQHLAYIEFVPYTEVAVAVERLRQHQLDLLMDVD